MPPLIVRGIVLRAADYKDYDRILTLFALGYGAMTVSAVYSRRTKSPLLNTTVPFVAGEFVLNSRNGRYRVSSCSVEEAHYALRDNPVRLGCASYLCAVCEETVQPAEPADTLFALLLRALAHLCYAEQAPQAITLCFLMRMLDDQGIGPVLTRCSRCGGDLIHPAFESDGAGAVCGQCTHGGRIVPLCVLKEADLLRHGPFEPPEKVSDEAFSLVTDYVTAHFEKSFRALEFLKKLSSSYPF